VIGDGHYRTLGVGPDASAVQIRDAYRRLARRHHPDRDRDGAATMTAINEAYRVLGDPGRRAVYDAGRRGSAVPPSPRTTTATPPAEWSSGVARRHETAGPARYPWKLVGVMAVVGIAVVLLGAILFEPADDPPPDNLLQSGSCVSVEDNGDAREVACDGAGDLVVRELVPIGDACPAGSEPHRDRQGRGTACITDSTVPAT